jgi:hypothetical protein
LVEVVDELDDGLLCHFHPFSAGRLTPHYRLARERGAKPPGFCSTNRFDPNEPV